ncbi:MAG: hypothetical protein ACHBNF_15260, partial [Chromatiales bacterium]
EVTGHVGVRGQCHHSYIDLTTAPHPHHLSLSGVTTRRHDRWGEGIKIVLIPHPNLLPEGEGTSRFAEVGLYSIGYVRIYQLGRQIGEKNMGYSIKML